MKNKVSISPKLLIEGGKEYRKVLSWGKIKSTKKRIHQRGKLKKSHSSKPKDK